MTLVGQVALIRNVSRDYFATVGAGLLEGRLFDASDQKSDAPVAIVNETFANRHFAGRSPLGQRLKFGNLGAKGHWYTIVGVVKPIRESGVARRSEARRLSRARAMRPVRRRECRHRGSNGRRTRIDRLGGPPGHLVAR